MTKTQNLRTFYILIITQTFSLIGSRMTGLALGIYVFNQTGQATPLALVALFSFLPQVVAGGIAGALADRWDRRYVMVLSDVGQALGTVILLVSFLTESFSVELLYLVTLIEAIFGTFQGPAFQASVTMLIPDDQRDRANAIQQLTSPAAGLIAPALAGALYALVGVSGVIGFDLFTFTVAVVVVLFLRIPRPAQTEIGRAMQGSIWREAFGGLQFLWRWRTLFWVNLQIVLVNFFFAGSTVVITPYLLARTGSEAALGTVLSVLNAGMIVGGVIMGVWGGTKPRIHTILPGIAIAACFLILLGAGQTALMLAFAGFFMMLPPPMINAAVLSLMQAKVPPDIQGRVFAAMGQMATFLIPLAYLLVGPLADQVFEPAVGKAGWERVAPLVGNSAGAGMGLMMVIAGIILVTTTTAVYLIPRVRHLEAELPDYTPTADSEVASGTTPEAAPG
jgi:DHA3 family macrolide efflux protein-like MFS transporter